MEFETTIEEAEVTISFDYQPEEDMVMYYPDGSGDPGCPASVDNIGVYWRTQKLNSKLFKHEGVVKHEGVEIDITDLLRELGYDLEELCWNHLENQ
tara:strand:+ start:3264 stop:3551 length:288 start_codon:yes stop_codon:yes gene_type:complete